MREPVNIFTATRTVVNYNTDNITIAHSKASFISHNKHRTLVLRRITTISMPLRNRQNHNKKTGLLLCHGQLWALYRHHAPRHRNVINDKTQ